MFALALLALQTYTLYFINTPESIKKEITICEIPFKSKSRFFFHFVNKTGRKITFHISTKTQSKSNLSVNINHNPGEAGTSATFGILTQSEKYQIINREYSVPKNYTISGILDVNSNNDVFSLIAGKGTDEAKGKVIASDCEAINDFSESFTYEIGREKNVKIPGNYGTTYKYNVVNNTDHIIRYNLSTKAEGGNIRLAFKINGVTKISDFIKAHHTKLISVINVKPYSCATIETIIPGGWCLPIKIVCKKTII